MMRRRLLVLTMWCVVIGGVAPAAAQQTTAEGGPDPRALWIFGFDNDIIADSDDGYTAGWSIERHSPALDTWGSDRLSPLSRFIGGAVPGLGDDGEGGRRVRSAWGIAQIIQTPENIRSAELQTGDVPWAGTIGVHASWSSVDDGRFNAVQLYLGCMGPCSGAEEIQTFVHDDLGLRVTPQGWDTQLDTTLLANLNYTLRRKLMQTGDIGRPGVLAADLSVGGQAGVGSFFNLAEAFLELRWGWGLPRGFTPIADPAGHGISAEPRPRAPLDDWQVSFALIPRFVYMADAATLDGGETADGRHHPGINYDRTNLQVVSASRPRRSASAHG